MAPAIEALSPDEDSEETLVVSKKKLEELVARLERHLEVLSKENEPAALLGQAQHEEGSRRNSRKTGGEAHDPVSQWL